jgi:hypothetical protein
LYGEELLAFYPNSKLEDHPVSAFCNCLFNTFAATLDIGGRERKNENVIVTSDT